MIVSNKVNDDDKYILHHAEIPGDGGLVVPQQWSYMKLGSVSYANVSVWLTDVAGRLPTLQNETCVTLSKEEATTNYVRGVDNAGKSIIVCGCNSCNKWREPIAYNKRCRRVDKVVWVEYFYVELVG